jgi:mannose-6-phosphate isomerase-like protein (cupin superfamily)
MVFSLDHYIMGYGWKVIELMKVYGYEEKVLAQYCYDGEQPEFCLAFPVHLIQRSVYGKLPQTHVPGHRHDFLEISYVLSGRAIQRVNDHAFQIREGDLCIINKGVDHAIIPEKDGSVKQMVLKLLPGYLLHHLLENRNAKHLICLLSHCSSFYFVKDEFSRERNTS